ncbi:BPTI/Kunitz domain-containing protein-like isoform X4 [Stegodyphus dumicola]|uniref:BPTI/Kunitz domain-containing protein-like isoform X4 n=1 Tax=Stegodyphus dumicola TaxID=202533 RepID=UPI0015AA2BAE|nr:BPTI/Kunitz domain-containing protein-like isoform X4 [Stegodyphus dumicola]
MSFLLEILMLFCFFNLNQALYLQDNTTNAQQDDVSGSSDSMFSLEFRSNRISDAQHICSLDPGHGDCCEEKKLKFHYNPDSRICYEILHKGCEGNNNTFDTMEQCETSCAGNAINKTEHCNKEGDRGTCEGLIHRFYYNSTLHECRGLEYGGCRGNANNFSTKQDCIRVCINFM